MWKLPNDDRFGAGVPGGPARPARRARLWRCKRLSRATPVPIARIQRNILLGQFVLAVCVGFWLAWGRDWPVPAAIAAGVLAPVGLHAAILAVDFAMAIAARGDRPPEARRGPLPWLRAWVVEVFDSVRTFSIAQPLMAWRSYPQPAVPSAIPVLTIHGYFCNRALWLPMAAALARHGHPVDGLDLEPPFASIDEHASTIAAAIDRLRERTGERQVALLCHSMGGLAARAYLRRYADDDAVARVITLGTPHLGTVHASLGIGHSARQMRLRSDWLKELARDETAERRRRFFVILSWHDNIVAPQAIQTLVDAPTRAFSGVGHMSLAYDRWVRVAVLDALAATPHRRGESAAPANSPSNPAV